MLEDFRTRMAELRQEMERLTSQAEELERIVREQQAHLEELELQVRQRDEQLGEQQALLEDKERELRERTEELEAARLALAEREERLSRQEQELEELRAQLAQREATEAVLREELARATVARRVPMEEATLGDVMERVVAIESRLEQHGEILTWLREGLARLTEQAEAFLALPRPIPAVGEATPPVPEAVAVSLEPTVAEAISAVPEAAERAAVPSEAPEIMQAILWEALEGLPGARVAGFAGCDGLAVEVVSRDATPASPLLEVELADLTQEASRVASALGTGPVLTVAFQAGETSCLVSPVGPDYFAFLLAPSNSMDNLRYAQAVLLQAASRLSELC